MDKGILINLSVIKGGISDHSPIVLKLEFFLHQPPSPLKFNHCWMLEEDFPPWFTMLGRNCMR